MNTDLSFDPSLLASPLSLILAAAFIIAIILLSSSGKAGFVRFFSGRGTAATLLGISAIAVAVEGTWKLNIYRTWPFAILVLLLMTAIGLAVLASWKKRSLAFRFSHLGIFLVLFGSFFGAPDVSQAQMMVSRSEASHVGYAPDGTAVPLPFKITLEDFRIERYEDGKSPKQFTSAIDIDGKTHMTSVNHPCRYKGWWIYQSDFDKDHEAFSVLRLVRDPWLPVVFLGMIVLAAAAILEMKKTWQSKAVLPVVILLAAAFTAISVAKISFSTLMPALRSLWFVPHLIVYMIAYSVMAIALVTGIGSIFSARIRPELPRKLLATSSSLLVIGMLCGAVWAKYAWGDYWSWDAKENWAAATWLLTLLGTHIPKGRKNLTLVAAIAISFLAMQVTWYGVNHLPAARYSMHTYTEQQ